MLDSIDARIIDLHLEEWTNGRSGKEALMAIFYHIRDIPYRVLPELNHPYNYIRILETHAGSCTPKHLLMAEMYRRLGWDVLLAVYPYSWSAFEDLYPPRLKQLARVMPSAKHLACNVLINGRYTLVDATIDPPLGKLGLPVNDFWDGHSDTLLPILPTGEMEVYHPTEALLMPPPRLDAPAKIFYKALNEYFDRTMVQGD